MRRASWPSPILGLATAGCVDDYVRQDGLWWVWLFLPVVVTLVLGAVAVRLSRVARLKVWDLRDSPGDPGTGILLWYTIVAVVLGLSFPVYSLFVEAVEPAQRMYNIIFWVLGGTTGSVGGWFAGMWLAARSFESG